MEEGPVAQQIRTRVMGALGGAAGVSYFSLVNDSASHVGHAGVKASGCAGDETHFKLHVVSDGFVGLSRVKRHQLVYASLGELMTTSIHALNIKAQTAAEYGGGPGNPGSGLCAPENGCLVLVAVL